MEVEWGVRVWGINGGAAVAIIGFSYLVRHFACSRARFNKFGLTYSLSNENC